MEKLIDVNAYPIIDVLPILLKDKSTKQNIIWATDAYTYRGTGYNDTDPMLEKQLTRINALQLQPRISKALEEQQDRTRKKAEVMTPVWLCNKMNNFADEQWFGRKDVFNHENEDNRLHRSWVSLALSLLFWQVQVLAFPFTKAENTTEGAMVTVPIVRLTMATDTAGGIMDMTMYTAVSSVGIKAAAVWTKERTMLGRGKEIRSPYML